MKLIFKIIFLIPLFLFSQNDFVKAEKLFQQEKFTLAKPLFESVVKETPHHLKALEYLGDIAGINKSWDNAIKYYGKLKHLRPREANYYYKYGGCMGMKAKESNKFAALGMLGDIKASFEKAIELNPNHIESRWALIELYLQLPGIVGGSEQKAQKYADELMIISKVDGFLAKGYIDEYFTRFAKAEACYLKAYQIGNSKLTYLKLYNLYLYKLKDKEKAKKLKLESENKKWV